MRFISIRYLLQDAQKDRDIADQAWSWFATGTRWQEMPDPINAQQHQVGQVGAGGKMVTGK